MRTRNGFTPLPGYIRIMIRQGLREYRKREALQFIKEWLYVLESKRQKVVSLRYGLGSDTAKQQNLTAIGAVCGFSRERARQLHDEGMLRLFGLKTEAEIPKALHSLFHKLQRYPTDLDVKERARALTRHAIKKGRISRQPCTRCGALKAEAHHPDYSKPLEVEWLCRKCHNKEHRELKEKAA